MAVCIPFVQFEAWIQEKLQIASDESFRDLTNIERKLKRHQAFEAEIAANKDGFDGINAVTSYITYIFTNARNASFLIFLWKIQL